MNAADILAAIAADPSVSPEFAAAIRPRRMPVLAEPDGPEDYSDEEPLRDDRYADLAAADWLAWRCS